MQLIKLNLIIMTVFASFFLIETYGQPTYISPCISLNLSANVEEIKLKDMNNYEILYSITNCSRDSLLIDTLSIPNYEERATGAINIKIYSRTGKCRYPANPKDLQQMFDFEHSHSIYLKQGQTYTYHINLFRYYDLEIAGDYTIYASYQMPINSTNGYYLMPAENYLYLTIE